MWVVVKGMSIRCYLKNRNYLISQRDFLSDYSRIKSKKIDMTLSGKYLSNYESIEIDIKKIDKYPSKDDIDALEDMIKKELHIKKEIIVGNGGNGLLQNIIKILFINKGNLVTPFYTFNQAEFGVSSFGGYTKRVYCNNYNIDLDKIKKSIDRKTRMIYICNPNNPTGIYINAKTLLEFTKKVKIPVVIDESGIEFTSKKSILDFDEIPNNLIVIRSFSKAYGLANLRIGYLVCNEWFKQKYLCKITTNEFSGISCVIAARLFTSKNIKINIENIVNERKKIENALKDKGIKLIKSDSNTIMTKTHFNQTLIPILEENDISVVPVYDENNLLHIRIAIQDKNTNNIFIKKIVKILRNNKNIIDRG